MALPYAALGVRAGAQHCTVPAGLELQGVGFMTAQTGFSRQLQRGTSGEPVDIQHADGLPADDRETERLPLCWIECVLKKELSEEVSRCDTMGFDNLQP
ncbi:hypothetical protein ABVT39_027241 [Epinephelus coioides]